MQRPILIIEDDPDIAESLKYNSSAKYGRRLRH